MAAVLSGSIQITLDASTDSPAPGQPLVLTATLESYGGSSAGSVSFVEGNRKLGTKAAEDSRAVLAVRLHALGVHYVRAVFHGRNGFVVGTTPIAITVGSVPATLTVSNRKHTVVGGRVAACDADKAAQRVDQRGCEVVSVHWLPGARIAYTLSYADGTSQTYDGIAGDDGRSQHVFAVKYLPPSRARHGEPATRAWISVVTTSRTGKQARSFCLRFAVLR